MFQSMIALVPWRSPWHGGVVFVLAGSFGLVHRVHAVVVRSTLLLASGIYRTWGETLALIGSRGKS